MIYEKRSGKVLQAFFPANAFSDTLLENPDITRRYLGTSLFDASKEASYYISDDQIAFAAISVKDSDLSLYIGPCLLADPSEAMMTSMMTRSNSPFRNDPKRYYDEIFEYIRILPRFSDERFLWLLTFFYNFLNHKVLSEKDLYPASISKRAIDLKKKDISSPSSSALFDQEALDIFLAELKALIRTAAKENAVKLFDDNSSFFFSSLSHARGKIDELRYAKNSFLMIIRSFADALKEEGVSQKDLFELMNELMNEAESCIVLQQIESLYRKAISSFCSLSLQNKTKKKSDSFLIRKAIAYIQGKIEQPLSASDIAEHLFVSRGYLSALFNKETGMSISEYINTEKIKLARHLLKETNNSIADIAGYLSYSSQSHFQNVFKKYCQTTPLRYRNSFHST